MSVRSDEAAFEQELWRLAKQEMGRGNLGISSKCAADLRTLIAEGVRRMQKSDRLFEDQARSDARDNLLRLVSKMQHEALMAGFSEMQESTLVLAKIQLCPGLWPFC